MPPAPDPNTATPTPRPGGPAGANNHPGPLGRAWEYVSRQVRLIWRKRKWPFDMREFDPQADFTGPTLGFHYTYHAKGGMHAYREADVKGFSIININSQWYRAPVTHGHMAMRDFHRYLETGDEQERRRFLGKADLLLDAKTRVSLDGRDCDLWQCWCPVRDYQPHATPWISCLAQSWAISVFCRAYQTTGRQEFLDSAFRSMATYEVPVEHGGIRATDPEGNVYYEEYAFVGQLHHVLNGFMSSLMGLYDLYRATEDKNAKRLFDEGIATVSSESVLDRYDKGYISAYDQAPWRGVNPSLPRYHMLHIRQLLILHRITGIDTLRKRAERWCRYSRDPIRRFRWTVGSTGYWVRSVPRVCRQVMAVARGRGTRDADASEERRT